MKKALLVPFFIFIPTIFYLFLNVAPDRGHWLRARAIGASGGDVLGAVVTCVAGDRKMHRTVRSAYSYCAANDPAVHFGLGQRAAVDSVSVRWPDGTVEEFGPVEVDRVVELRRGTGR